MELKKAPRCHSGPPWLDYSPANTYLRDIVLFVKHNGIVHKKTDAKLH
jgi:hypothetical protein